MTVPALKAAEILEDEGISVEVIDLRSVKPLDKELLVSSVKKTGRLIVADGGWKTCGIAAEVAALAGEHAFKSLKAPVKRVALPDAPAPASRSLERHYYPDEQTIVKAAKEIIKCSRR